MILNFEELDRKVEKILNILAIKGFSYEIFSNQRRKPLRRPRPRELSTPSHASTTNSSLFVHCS